MKLKLINHFKNMNFYRKPGYLFLIVSVAVFLSFFQFQYAGKNFNNEEPISSLTSIVGSSDFEKRSSSLFEVVKAHPEGFTVDSKTFQPVRSGFAVAPFFFAQIIIDRDRLTVEQIQQMISSIDRLTQLVGKPVYAGGWFNTNNKRYYLDASMVVMDLDEALYLAKAGNQQAVYDLAVRKVIKTRAGISQLKKSGSYSELKEKSADHFVNQINTVWESL